MSDPFIGQIMPVAFGFAPRNWAQCDGATLSITQNQVLFALIGTAYGGDGRTTFKLPDLRGRTPLGQSDSYALGQAGGTESVALQASQIPQHVQTAGYTTQAGASRNPTDGLFGDSGASSPIYAGAGGPQVALHPATVGSAGQGQPHSNLQPYTALNFCIALSGVFPSRN
jgi:microcystin-dependent protein